MPTYEYECDSCGHTFELFQRFSDEPAKTCQKCGGPVRRVFSPVGIIFKGTGWYSTDNRKTGTGGTTKARASANGNGKSSEEKTDTVADTAAKSESSDKVSSGV